MSKQRLEPSVAKVGADGKVRPVQPTSLVGEPALADSSVDWTVPVNCGLGWYQVCMHAHLLDFTHELRSWLELRPTRL